VLDAEGTHRVSVGGPVLASAANDPARLPCAGDWVVVRAWPDGRTAIEHVLPRRTAIVRAAAGREALAQVLAANIDTAAVVAAVDPEPDLGRIERLLAIVWESGARPLVILTKVDLAAYPDALADEVSEIAPGVEVYGVSAQTGTGVPLLRPYVGAGQTLGLLGVSGAGKSTLVNALAGTRVMTTQAIRRADGRGRHTTTHRALIPLPSGGAVIDMPGIRAVGLIDGVSGLGRAFGDIDELGQSCRYDDCGHVGVPDCAVLEALATGELPHRRYESWLKLRSEISHETRRSGVRLSLDERRQARRLRNRARDQRERRA
jgi:ribosome biogenesis GTPase